MKIYEEFVDLLEFHHKNLTQIAMKYGEFEGNVYTYDGRHTSDFQHTKMKNLFNIAQHCKDTVLEIGFNVGNSALIFLVANENINFLAVDIMIHGQAVLESVDYLNTHFNNRIKLYQGDSLNIIPSLPRELGEKISLYHIDGLHSIEGIKADLKNCYDLAKPSSFVICDDTNNKCIEDEYNTYVTEKKIKDLPEFILSQHPYFPHLIGNFLK